MTLQRTWPWWCAVLALSFSCGPAGSLSGTVTVGGGSSADLPVYVYGPASSVTVTKDDGSFSVAGLPDGRYVVRVVVKGAEVEDQSTGATIKNGKTDGNVALSFKFSVGKVTGKVVLADGSDPSTLTVTLQGAISRAVRAGGDGTFSFDGVPAGAYIAAVEAPDTREGRVGVGVGVQTGSVDVGELRLTPVGRLAGTVNANNMPVAGATVLVAGSSLVATTDAMGKFSLAGIPTGSATIVARTTAPPRVVSQSVMVMRGTNADLTLSLMEETRRGTVTGTVTFVGQQSPRIISVTVPGTAATATPAGNGAYTLQVPEGDWDIVATAPSYPKKVIGHVHVIQGQTTTLPGEVLSWYEPIWEDTQSLTSIGVSAVATAPSTWVLIRVNDGTGFRTLLINRGTKEVRLLAAGPLAASGFSSGSKYLYFVLAGQVFTYEIASAELKAWDTGTDPSFNYAVFSSDESKLFVSRYTGTPATPGSFLERIDLVAGTTTRFPTTGVVPNVSYQTSDRHFLLSATGDVTMVTPTTETPTVFTQVTTLMDAFLNGSPVAMALTACGGAPVTCSLKILPNNATAAVSVVGAAGTFGNALSSFGGTGDWPWVQNATGYDIIRAMDGQAYPLLTGSSAPVYNQTATRFAYHTTVAAVTALREDVFPPSQNPSPLVQVTAPTAFTGQPVYITPTRLIDTDLNTTATAVTRRIHDIRSGLLTTENDLPTTGPTAGMYGLQGSMVAWPSVGTGKWKVIIADKSTLAIDVGATTTLHGPATLRARPWTANVPAPEVGVISFDGATGYTIDAQQQVKRSSAGSAVAALGAERLTTNEVWYAVRPFGPGALVLFSNDQVIDVNDPAMTLFTTTNNTVDRTYFAANDRQLSMAWLR